MDEVKRGAEAVVTVSENRVLKERVPKGYRVSALDDFLRSKRTRQEAKLISLAKRAGVPAPLIRHVDPGKGVIEMSHIAGAKLKDVLNNLDASKRIAVCRTIGTQIGRLHSHHIIHGDLTTSNMIL